MDVAAQLRSALAERYRIDREIGTGGMAVVYLAYDVKHERRVALKVLRPELSSVLGDGRFLAEIKVTAHLQHPNLLPLFDSGEVDGLLYYVMPYVEGETLRHRLAREKQLPVDEALRLATAIAGALDYAHRQGVIHRDLKPENILLQEGQPLVADFGIALAVSKAGGARVTQTGISLGTPQYMSPEQATGDRAIDARADIYSLGAVIYEMLTGDPPHVASTAQAVLAKVLTDRPTSVRAVRASVPVNVSMALDRALEKLPADRFASAQALADALTGRSALPEVPAVATRRGWMPKAFVAVSVVAAGAIGLAGWALSRSLQSERAQPARFLVTFPPGIQFSNIFSPLAITHDGSSLFIRAQVGQDDTQLVRRRLDDLDLSAVKGSDNAATTVVSADDKWLAFFASSQRLVKLPIDGGATIPIANVGGYRRGIEWTPDGTLILGIDKGIGGLSIVSSNGGELKPLTKPDTAKGEVEHGWPLVLADGNTVVYVAWYNNQPPKLGVTTLRSGGTDARSLEVRGTKPLGMIDGYLLYVTLDHVLSAVPFDARSRRTTGAPAALMGGIDVVREVGHARALLSNSGTLVYVGDAAQLLIADVSGSRKQLTKAPGSYGTPAWSPDGRHIALTVTTSQGTDIWLCDATSGALSKLTTDGSSLYPMWTRDSKHVVFVSARGGRPAAWRQATDGGAAEKLFEDSTAAIGEALLAPDDHTLIYRTDPQRELFFVDLTGDRKPVPIDPSPSTKVHPALSADGKLLAYVTDAGAGGRPIIVVRPFPGSGATQATIDGTDPAWSADGNALYFYRGRHLVSVPINQGPELRLGASHDLFEGAFYSSGSAGHQNLGVSPDGKRFVFITRAEPLVVVTNFATELRKRLAKPR